VVWVAAGAVIGFKLLTDTGEASAPPLPPQTHLEPDVRVEDLDLLCRMWQRGDIPEAASRRAVALAMPTPPQPAPATRPAGAADGRGTLPGVCIPVELSPASRAAL